MSYETRGSGTLDYLPCRYGSSRLMFRGPKRRLQGDYVAVLGGTETYGKFIEAPFPNLIEDQLGTRVVNLGCVNAGVDAFTQDPALLHIANQARAVVVQVMGAQNMSNRLYTVHPRRNDRFVNASTLLKAVYREVDFTEFHFTRHMLKSLRMIDASRFEMVRDELKLAWRSRMRLLISQINRPVLVMWFAPHKPPACGTGDYADPMFVDSGMLSDVAHQGAGLVEVVASQAAIEEQTDRMIFDDLDRAAAEEQLSVLAHEEAAEKLGATLKKLL